MISSTNQNDKVPERYAHAEFDDIPKKVKDAVLEMMQTRKGIYIFGECGVGKTHIAYGIFKRAVEKSVKCRMYKSTEMLDLIRDFYGKNSYDYNDNELKKLLDYTGVLIIDDIGVEKPTEWVAETFYKIIDKRYEEKLPTIFTSNFSLGELADKISDRISSRIAEMCDVIKLGGVDKRL